MALLGWLWLASPFAVIGLIARDRGLLALISAHHGRCQAIGWTGTAMMLLGVAFIQGAFGTILFFLGTPLAGLAVWGLPGGGDRGDDGADGNGGGDGGDGGDGPPGLPPVDWDEFERSFWGHVHGRSTSAGGPGHGSAWRRSATRSSGSSTPQLSRTRSRGTAAVDPSTD
jgi:hypothetical protein